MLKHLKFLLPATGTNESRKNLMWLKCVIKDEYIHMTAANGFIIKIVKAYFGTETPDCEFYIDGESIKKCIKIVGKDDNLRIEKDRFKIHNIEIKYQPYECEYPNLDRLMSGKIVSPVDKIGLNLNLFTLATKNADIDKNYSFIKIENMKNKESDPIGVFKVDFNNHEQFAYVMPVAIEW